MEIIKRIERVECKYIDDIDQEIHEKRMKQEGWCILSSHKQSQTINATTIFEKEVWNKFTGDIIRW